MERFRLRMARMILGLGAGTGLEVAEEIGLRAAEMVAEDAEGTGGIAESLRDELGRDALHELCAEASHWRQQRKNRPFWFTARRLKNFPTSSPISKSTANTMLALSRTS